MTVSYLVPMPAGLLVACGWEEAVYSAGPCQNLWGSDGSFSCWVPVPSQTTVERGLGYT